MTYNADELSNIHVTVEAKEDIAYSVLVYHLAFKSELSGAAKCFLF